jgi:hypothetical protein
VTAQQVTSPVPDFTVALQAVLEFLGVSPVLVDALLLASAAPRCRSSRSVAPRSCGGCGVSWWSGRRSDRGAAER